MSAQALWDALAAACLLAGALLCLAAGVGLLRFPDALARMHAATKPQTLGLLLVLAGAGLGLREWRVVGVLLLVGLFQVLTTPIGAQLLGRATYRTRRYHRGRLVVDELARDLADSADVPERTGDDG